MLFRVKIPAFLRLEELRSYCESWTVPPKPAKQISPSCLLSKPTARGQIWGTFLEIEPIHALIRNRSVSCLTLLSRRASEVQIKRWRFPANLLAFRVWKALDSVTYCTPLFGPR
jgi:hypothetical protein